MPPRALTADILVTGAGGFIGKYLVKRLLTSGHFVRVLVRRPPNDPLLLDPRVEVIQGNLADAATVARAVEGSRLVFHLGAAMRGSAADFEQGTIVGTQNVVASVASVPETKLVYVSSLSVLHAAAARVSSVVREDWPLEPHPELRGHYTGAKLRAEAIVRDGVRTQQLSAVIVRPGQVFGPGAELMTPAVARKMRGRMVIIGNGELVLPLIYVEDLVDALVAAAERDVRDGSVFHIVDETPVTQNELVERYVASTQQRPGIVHIPIVAMQGAGLLAQIAATVLRRTPALSPYRISSALAPLRFDCQAARNQLGWTPAVGVRRGLDIVFRQSSEAADTAKVSHS